MAREDTMLATVDRKSERRARRAAARTVSIRMGPGESATSARATTLPFRTTGGAAPLK